MELANVFVRAADQQAFERWIDYMKSNDIWMELDGIENIIEAQRRPMTGHPGSGRGYSYGEYFTRATWDKTMPPIEQVQIFEMPTIETVIPTFETVVPTIDTVIPSIDTLFPDSTKTPLRKPMFGPKLY